MAAAGSFRAWLVRPGAGSLWLDADPVQWAQASCTAADRALADRVAEGVFDLLGSGPIRLGRPPAWRRDLYTGREWPLAPSWRYHLDRADGSDIRTVWELSRAYHFVALARAHWSTGDARYQTAFVQHVESWIRDNPVGYGPHWASPMDAAIRAANWTLAAYLFGEEGAIPEDTWRRLLENLFVTGLYVERYLEWHPRYRGNHYVANAVGLLYLGVLFRDLADGARWRLRGARMLAVELARQVYADGVSFEAALGYHRLVTELFTYGGELLERNAPALLPDTYWMRVAQMYRFIEAYLADHGVAPMLGDADDGRLHLVAADALADPRRHRLGLPPARFPGDGGRRSTAFPNGGFYILRGPLGHLVVRCGPVGLDGAGSHDHNDQLSFELMLGGLRVVADSGTYTYTRDLAARQAFRSTAAHSTVQLGDAEQNPIEASRPWAVRQDRARARCVRWDLGPEQHLFEGEHRGFAHRASGAVVRRTIVARQDAARWIVTDRIAGHGEEAIVWRLHLGVLDAQVEEERPHRIVVRLQGRDPVSIVLERPAECAFAIEPTAASERYGTQFHRPCLVLRGRTPLPAVITCEFRLGTA